jgi:predicted SAM-dependent methyltransferase
MLDALRTRLSWARRVWAFAGTRFRCAVCGARLRDFLPLSPFFADRLEEHGWPHGLDQFETLSVRWYECPLCGASDRDRLCALFLDGHLPRVRAGGLILDFAPSTPLSRFIRRRIDPLAMAYRTVDRLRDDVECQADIMNLDGFDTASCDLFLCAHVLEHVADDRRALAELRRILRPGGVGLLLVPILLTSDAIDEDPAIVDEGERWRRFAQGDHVRLYCRRGFIERVEEAGFKVRAMDQAAFGAETFRRNGLDERSVLYVVG